jgi:hypothetical protein
VIDSVDWLEPHLWTRLERRNGLSLGIVKPTRTTCAAQA